MKKKLSALLATAIISATAVTAFAVTTSPVYGNAQGNSWSGYLTGSKNSSNCYAAAYTNRQANQGTSTLYAYAEIVNDQGYTIGTGTGGTGFSAAYSGTITRSGGNNAHGSHGLLYSEPTRSYTVLY